MFPSLDLAFPSSLHLASILALSLPCHSGSAISSSFLHCMVEALVTNKSSSWFNDSLHMTAITYSTGGNRAFFITFH